MKGALTLFAQDADSKLILYTGADIKKGEADDEVLEFLSFWKATHRKVAPTLVFDAKFTTYANLSELNRQGVKFITLRRRGRKLLENVDRLSGWERITIPHEKRKYPNPQVHESLVSLKGYEGSPASGHRQGQRARASRLSRLQRPISPRGDPRRHIRPQVAGGERHLGGGHLLPPQQPLFLDPRQSALRCRHDHDCRHALFNACPVPTGVRALRRSKAIPVLREGEGSGDDEETDRSP